MPSVTRSSCTFPANQKGHGNYQERARILTGFVIRMDFWGSGDFNRLMSKDTKRFHWMKYEKWPNASHYTGQLRLFQQNHRLSGLNNRHLFRTVMDVEKTKIKVPASSVPGEGPPPGLHSPLLPVFLHGGESALGSILHLIRALNPITTAPSSWPHPKWIIF